MPGEASTAAGIASAIGGVLSTAASVGGTMFGALASRKYNERMWHENNEYNAPINQMRRFSDAGLNPNLIYGQGTSGNSAHSPTMEPLRFDWRAPQDSVAIANAMTNIAMTRAQIRKTEQETKNAELNGVIMARDALAARLEQHVMENEGPLLTQSPWLAGIESKLLQNRLALQKLNFLDQLNPLTIRGARLQNVGKMIGNWQDLLNYQFAQQMNPLRLRGQDLMNQQTARNISVLNAKIGLLGAQTDLMTGKSYEQGYRNFNILPKLNFSTNVKNKLLKAQYDWFNTNQMSKMALPLLKMAF